MSKRVAMAWNGLTVAILISGFRSGRQCLTRDIDPTEDLAPGVLDPKGYT